jgi:hypothetical protein
MTLGHMIMPVYTPEPDRNNVGANGARAGVFSVGHLKVVLL